MVAVLLALSAQNERLQAQVEQLTARVARQDERIAQLERRLNRSSRNSSQPPSADPPGARAKRVARIRRGAGRVASPGMRARAVRCCRRGRSTRSSTIGRIDCECGHVFAEDERVAVGDPVRHQVEELPPITVTVTEHRCQRVRCPGCGRRRRAELPREVAGSMFGPRFQAAVATLSVRNRIVRRDVVELCEQLFGSRISTGTVDAILCRVADALVDPCEDLLGSAARQPGRAHGRDGLADRRAAPRAVGHLRSASRLPARRRRPSRGPRQEPARRHHGGRDLVIAGGPTPTCRSRAANSAGRTWLATSRRTPRAWPPSASSASTAYGSASACSGPGKSSNTPTTAAELQATIRELQREFKPIVRRYAGKSPRYKYCRGIARNLLKAWPALWTFARHPGVEPTNNHAERALRGAVIYRKLSLGSQSSQGEQRIARLLSAHTTCRLQRRPLHAYLTDALAAHTRGDPVPLLT